MKTIEVDETILTDFFQCAAKVNMALEEFIKEEDFVINEHLKVIQDNIRLIIGGLVEIVGDKGSSHINGSC
jgi:hypothetical protein